MQIGIIGCGLIGGTLAFSLKEKNIAQYILGFDIISSNTKIALERNFIDAIANTLSDLAACDLIIIATPVSVANKILADLLLVVQPHTVIMDVGSTKEHITKVVENNLKRSQFVATHPMWGTEFSGPQAAVQNANLLQRVVVICDKEKSSEKAIALVENLYKNLGMNILYMNAVEHDIHAAYISHISHISSFALSLTVLEKEKEEDKIFALASGGFESTVRLAKSQASMWVPIFEQNRGNVLDVMNELIHQLKQMKKMIEMEQYEALTALIDHANDINRILK